MAGYFEIKKAKDGSPMFNLKAGNHEIILTSQMYSSMEACKAGIESVKKNAALDERFEKTTTASGKFRFALKASNGQTIGTSETYESAASRDKGIASVMKNAPGADTKEVE